MRKDDCFELGHIIKPHGLEGRVWMHIDADDPFAYEELESVFLERKGELIPFFIEDIEVKGDKALVYFDEIRSVDEAMEINGSKVWLPLSVLPELGPDQYYFHELPGFTVEDEKHGPIGSVTEIISGAAQNLLRVIDPNNREILIPMVEEIILQVDKPNQLVKVNLPDGLLDLYLNEE